MLRGLQNLAPSAIFYMREPDHHTVACVRCATNASEGTDFFTVKNDARVSERLPAAGSQLEGGSPGGRMIGVKQVLGRATDRVGLEQRATDTDKELFISTPPPEAGLPKSPRT